MSDWKGDRPALRPGATQERDRSPAHPRHVQRRAAPTYLLIKARSPLRSRTKPLSSWFSYVMHRHDFTAQVTTVNTYRKCTVPEFGNLRWRKCYCSQEGRMVWRRNQRRTQASSSRCFGVERRRAEDICRSEE